MNRINNNNKNFSYRKFKDISKNNKEKIAEIIEKKQAEMFLAPTVEGFMYGTARALDFGDYYGIMDKRAKWEHSVNNNSDYFDVSQLEEIHSEKQIPRYLTFRTAGLFLNHNSQDIGNSIGLVFDSYLVKDNYMDMHCNTLIGVDQKKAPPAIIRSLKTYPTRIGVSMGCAISESNCSICNHVVKADNDMCDHLRYNRGQRVQGKKVAEILKGINFHELSIVGSPAASKSYIFEIISKIVPGRLLKVAQEQEDGMEVARIMATIYHMIHDAKNISERKRLSNQLDMLVHKLETLEKKRIA